MNGNPIKGWFLRFALFIALLLVVGSVLAQSWSTAKKNVYARDAGEPTFYCGCSWENRVVDLSSCGYVPRKNRSRALRTEVEHIVPAKRFGGDRPCWAEGGREHCYKHDPVFREMHNDPANLAVAIGEINGDRSARAFGQVAGESRAYGHCDFEIDGVAEPRREVRRYIVSAYLYFAVKYGMALTEEELSLFTDWLRE